MKDKQYQDRENYTNVIVIKCDHGHVLSLITNELYIDPQKSKKRFSELIFFHDHSVTVNEMKEALKNGIFQTEFIGILRTSPSLRGPR